MLTRAGVKQEVGDDIDWDAVAAMTDEEAEAEDAAFNREVEGWVRDYQARLRTLTGLQRYRLERHHALVSLLRCRTRLDFYRREAMLNFMVARELALLKKRQSELLDWRRFLVTGIVPISGTN